MKSIWCSVNSLNSKGLMVSSFCFIAKKPACAHLRGSPGSPTPPSVPADLPAGKGAPQGEGSPAWAPLLQTPPRGVSPVLMASLHHPTRLYGDLFCSFGCVRGLLPAFSWFSMWIFLHVDVFLMYLSGMWTPHPPTPPSWSSSTFLLFLSYWTNISSYKKDKLLQIVFSHSKKYAEQ